VNSKDQGGKLLRLLSQLRPRIWPLLSIIRYRYLTNWKTLCVYSCFSIPLDAFLVFALFITKICYSIGIDLVPTHPNFTFYSGQCVDPK
jgi:hypothetical protein